MKTNRRVTSTDYGRPHRPLPITAMNRIGRLLDRVGHGGADLTEETLLAAARRRTGLDDFGDESFREGLRILLASLGNEARLHPIGRFLARQNLIRILACRLRIRDALLCYPEILDQEIEPPVFIVGLQRTGTTMLHRLLARDPVFRFLSSWEAINPAPLPPPGPLRHLLPLGYSVGRDPRVRVAQLAQRGLAFMAPDFFAIHPVDALGPEEDCLLFDYSFSGTVPEATWRVPSYSAWLERQDHARAYQSFAGILKYLQWQRHGGRWVLKTPQHLEHLDALLAVFGQARIVQTHRDPTRTVASFCSMMAHARGVFSDEVDPHEVARHWADKARRMVQRSMEVRDRVEQVEQFSPAQFLDVSYYDLKADPLREVQRVYDFLGIELTGRAMTRMQAWRNENPQHKHGRHRYRLEDFGLTRAGVEEMFAAYRERYNIPRE